MEALLQALIDQFAMLAMVGSKAYQTLLRKVESKTYHDYLKQEYKESRFNFQ